MALVLITIISWPIKLHSLGQLWEKGPVPGLACAGSPGPQALLHSHSSPRQVDGALLGLGSVPSLPNTHTPSPMAPRKTAGASGCPTS